MAGAVEPLRVSARVRAWSATILFVVAVGAVWLLGAAPPAWYPECVVHRLSGWHCPGCGSARAVHALLHGEWRVALHDNALLILVLPGVGWWAAASWWRGVRHDLAPRVPPDGMARIMLAAVAAFTIARNLPWWPFRLLAPA